MSFRTSRTRLAPINTLSNGVNIKTNKSSEEFLTDLYDDELEDPAYDKGNFIRRALFFFTTSPSDLLISLNETLEAIDWDAKSRTIAQPFGNGLTFLFFIMRFLQDNVIYPNYHKIHKKSDAFDLSKSKKLKSYSFLKQYALDESKRKISISSFWYMSILKTADYIITMISSILILLNIYLTYKFFSNHYKSYSIFNCDPELLQQSKHLTRHPLNELTQNQYYFENASKGSIWTMLKCFLFDRRKENNITSDAQEYYFKLKKWHPSKFMVNLFISFSPIGICFLFFSEVSFLMLIPIAFQQLLLHHLIIEHYELLIVDNLIIASATMNEYNSKIVRPKTSKRIQEVMVDSTPKGHGYVRFFPSTGVAKQSLFETHTLSGELIKEKYNKKKGRFEVLDIDNSEREMPHNIIVQAPYHRPKYRRYGQRND
ncbi:Nur1p NDAI_0B03120 [Naumovozyma dairenensis CBS 421]|uniref:Nuclear rim protein 1 n=1 Tax=Naumovozyma dairenensis (strain ATCC 10597 / BCRC 20456 / CBS 421 / NBRC 0211 / NRRL Y-12639) TaxID=1071378 RepID=G0W6D6_NAUDC|nr:hypothetical protein NDAI_0B03120 [Naumovozyma dairenensis CBS 421]CCD23347.1 hypothetical protein NDAI_0B03120 [Naumovozyma dairenensis CBS 421]